MSITIDLGPDGPHCPELTSQAADVLAECVRFLNHATGRHAGQALAWPADAYQVLGSLYTGTGRMPQLFTQLGTWLAGQAAAGTLADDRGQDVAVLVAAAGEALAGAATAAEALTARLEQAQQAIAGLHVRHEDPGPGSRM
jgi:hypothetical protein